MVNMVDPVRKSSLLGGNEEITLSSETYKRIPTDRVARGVLLKLRFSFFD